MQYFTSCMCINQPAALPFALNASRTCCCAALGRKGPCPASAPAPAASAPAAPTTAAQETGCPDCDGPVVLGPDGAWAMACMGTSQVMGAWQVHGIM